MGLSLLFLIAFFDLSIIANAVYVPGTPGAEWSVEEMLAVKHLLHKILNKPEEALKRVPEGPHGSLDQKFTGQEMFDRYKKFGDIKLKDAVLPDIPKLVRLAFHDCVPDSETGGCNGCLNFHNMGKEGKGVKSQACHFRKECTHDSLPRETDNNNLVWAARVLEMVYNDNNLMIPRFTVTSPDIDKYKGLSGKAIQGSLRERGKSRADLWALAALTAAELGMHYHNSQCDARNMTLFCGGNPDNDPCEAKLPLPKFKYGRKDCTSQCEGPNNFYEFCTNAKESHPDPHGNGNSVTTFFKEEFQLSAKETIALMGAHTLGHSNERISGFRHYPWTSDYGKVMLNNDYYKILARPGGWRRLRHQSITKWNNECQSESSTFVGDEYGNSMKMNWVARSQWLNNDGGPWQWHPFALPCDKRVCDTITDLAPTSCCHFFKENGECDMSRLLGQCDKGWCKPSDEFNCSIPGFMGMTMMNVDMGLYTKFQITEGDKKGFGRGRPSGCPGLSRADWLKNLGRRPGIVNEQGQLKQYTEAGYLDYSSFKINGNQVAQARYSSVIPGNRFSGCGLNTDIAENGQKWNEIVEEYASNNNAFVQDFSDVLLKMMENGYQNGNSFGNQELKTSSWKWVNMRCDNKICKLML